VRAIDADRALKDVGRPVAELRRERGWTQEQLAERLGLQTNNLQRIELGMQNLTVRSLARLANGLGVKLPSLFETPRSHVVRPGRPRRTGTA
jgi:transcriptional regulator with XRE-family HTH domain